MLKTLTRDDTTTTPYVATKNWNLSNVANEDSVLSEAGNLIAAETIDYFPTFNQTNFSCNVAKENQSLDLVKYREGLKTSGIFYPDLDPKNLDGTYKRMVYTQIKTMFYNNFRDPTKVWGTEKIDFDTSKTKKFLSDSIKLFDIPTSLMGQKIVEGSVSIIDNTLDNDYLITDDKNCNLFAGTNLFSKQQELGEYSNIFNSGSDSTCEAYFSFAPPGPPVLVGTSINIFQFFGSGSLSWSEPTAATIDGWGLEKSLDGISFSLLSFFDEATTSTYDFPLSASTDYFYRVYAFNIWGTSSYSNIVDIFVDDPLSGDPFDEYITGQTDGFDSGSNWPTSSWRIDQTVRFLASESWEQYNVGQSSSFDKGYRFLQLWTFSTGSFFLTAFEPWNEYTTSQNTTFNSGHGFSDVIWIIR